MRIKSFVLGLVAAVGFGGAVSAATITFDLGTASTGGWKNAINYSSGGLGLSITGGSYSNNGGVSAGRSVATWAGHGLGVADRFDTNHQIDGYGANDLAILTFSKAVTIVSVAFNYVNSYDFFDFFTGQSGNPTLVSWNNRVKPVVTFANPSTASVFGIGASQTWSAFKLWSITVNVPDEPAPVPVPAAGVLLVGGLGAIAALRRKRRAA